jgi:hypothetical protein
MLRLADWLSRMYSSREYGGFAIHSPYATLKIHNTLRLREVKENNMVGG